MNFEADFNRLEKTVSALRSASFAIGATAVGLLFLALMLSPGPFGGVIRFTSVMIHLDLQGYVADLGAHTRLMENALVFGIPLLQIKAALRIFKLLVGIAAIGSILRLQWRWALGAGFVFLVMFVIDRTIETRAGYLIAEPKEFAVVQPEAKPNQGPSGSFPVVANFRTVGQSAGDPMAEAREQQARADAERVNRAARMRADFDDPPSETTPPQKAAMHFMGAQIGYLEENLPATLRHLNAISTRDFNPTWDADYRLRIIREWVQKNGGSITPTSYAPTTGIPFDVQRVISKVLAAGGAIALVIVFMIVELSRHLARKIRRLRSLAAGLANDESVTSSGRANFGRRAGNAPPDVGIVVS